MRYICLRDDDTNFLTEYDELASGYGKFWGEIPVTLATVPFVHGSELKIMDYEYDKEKFVSLRKWQLEATADELSNYHTIHPIGLNANLIDQLKPLINQGKLEIAQHGVMHRYDDGGAEMKNGNYNYRIIRDGKEYLEKVFDCRVNVFIPPSNTIDIKNARSLMKIGMMLMCCGSFYYYSTFEKILEHLLHPEDFADVIKTRFRGEFLPLRRRHGAYIANSITFDTFKDDEYIYECVKKSLDSYRFASMTTHYRLLEDKFIGDLSYRERYQKMLGRLSELPDVEFVTASKYFELMEERL